MDDLSTPMGTDRADERFLVLALRYLADDLDDAGLTEMESLLASSHARCDELSTLALHTRLMSVQLAAEHRESARSPQSIAYPAEVHRSPVLGFLANISRHVPGGEFTVGSLLMLVLVAAFWGLSQAILFPRLGGRDLAHDLSPLAPGERGAGGEGAAVATITASANAEWSPDSDSPPRPSGERGSGGEGSAVTQGQPLSITSGLVELQLKQGTTLLIEGPADWKIDGDNSATLSHGKLVARVPEQAIGFTLETPTARIVDLGTEFGVEVDSTGDTEVHVRRGLVETSRTAVSGGAQKVLPPVRVTAGESLRLTQESAQAIPSNSSKFVDGLPAAATDLAFDPGKLSGLRLWLRSDRGITIDAEGRVERWQDQTGNKFDAEQPAPESRPLFCAADQNSRAPAVRFDGVNDLLVCEGGLDFDLAGNLTIFVAVTGFQRFQENVGIFSLCSKGGKDWNCLDGLAIRQGIVRGTPIVGAVQAANQDWTMPGFNHLRAEAQVPPRGSVVISLTKQNGVATIRVNGNTSGVDEFNFGPVADQPSRSCAGYVLGTRADNTNLTVPLHFFGAVQIAEIVVYDRALDGKEGSRTDAYLIERVNKLSTK